MSELHRETTAGAAETESLGARIARELRSGDIVLLSGDLGAGKTTFIRGACRALGVTEPVTSPTFTIGRRYQGQGVRVSHLDLFRLKDLDLEEPWLLDDYLTSDSISFIEWPDTGAGHLEREGVRVAMRVELRHAGGDRREISLVPGAAVSVDP